MKKTILLSLLVLLIFSCEKEELTPENAEIFEIKIEGDTYTGIVKNSKVRAPGYPCGVNGCGAMLNLTYKEDYEIVLNENKNEYDDGVVIGEFEKNETQIVFKTGRTICANVILGCDILLPLDTWINYQLEGDTLSFAYTDSLEIKDGFMDRFTFELIKEN